MAKLGSFAVGGRDSYPDQCNDTPPCRIGEAGKLRLLQAGTPAYHRDARVPLREGGCRGTRSSA
ncbi:MAG: hypothetical protein IJR26_02605 [Bacteroidales bacterium]|nr:hypothetical protein [Bacteroidales bacterium]